MSTPTGEALAVADRSVAPYVLGCRGPVVVPRRIQSVSPGVGDVVDAAALLLDGLGVTWLECAPAQRGDPPALVVDFGREVCGHVEVDVVSGSAGELVLSWSEALRHLGSNGDYARRPELIALDPAEGWQRASRLAGGFRYLRLQLRGPGRAGIRAIRAVWSAQSSDDDHLTGSFVCSDDLVTRLWYASVYTVQLCTVPGARGAGRILDGAKRDRMYWTGDLVVEAPVAYMSFGAAAARDSLSVAASRQLADGYIPVYSGNEARPLRWLQYVAFWVSGVWTYTLHTGDTSLASEVMPALMRAVHHMGSHCDPADGLIISGPVDGWTWHSPPIPGKEASTNVAYAASIRDAARIAGVVGDGELAAQWRVQADRLRASVNRVLWNERLGALAVSELFPDAVPQDANALGAYTGVLDANRARRALECLRTRLRTELGTAISGGDEAVPLYGGPYISPFMTYFEVSARMCHGDEVGAMELLSRTYGHMLDGDPYSTMWERFALDGGEQGGFAGRAGESKAHGWSAGPALVGTQLISGVEPVTPGYAEWRIAPHRAGLNWAEASVPTAFGSLRTLWAGDCETGDMTVDVDAPEGTRGTVRLSTDRPVRLGGRTVERSATHGVDIHVTSGHHTITVGAAAVPRGTPVRDLTAASAGRPGPGKLAVRWSHDTGGQVVAAASSGPRSNVGTGVVLATASGIHGFDSDSGLRWTRPVPAGASGLSISSLGVCLVSDGVVELISALDGNLIATVDVPKRITACTAIHIGEAPYIVSATEDGEVVASSVHEGSEQWVSVVPGGGHVLAAVPEAEGFAVGCEGNRVVLIRAADGEHLFSWRTGAEVHHLALGRSGALLAGDDKGCVHAFDVHCGLRLWTSRVGDVVVGLDVDDSGVWVGTSDGVLALLDFEGQMVKQLRGSTGFVAAGSGLAAEASGRIVAPAGTLSLDGRVVHIGDAGVVVFESGRVVACGGCGA